MVQLDFNFEAILKLQLTQSWYLCRSPELIIILFFPSFSAPYLHRQTMVSLPKPRTDPLCKKRKAIWPAIFFAFLKKTAAWMVYNTAGCKLVTPFKKY